jgi:hypothetical protein
MRNGHTQQTLIWDPSTVDHTGIAGRKHLANNSSVKYMMGWSVRLDKVVRSIKLTTRDEILCSLAGDRLGFCCTEQTL